MRCHTIPRADLMALQRHLIRCHLDDVGFKQRRDDVGRDEVIGREQAGVADRTFAGAAINLIFNDQVAGEAW